MALVVFLRGVNVGGHRRFRPSLLPKALSDYDVVNIGAAGTFVVRKPGKPAKFQAALRKELPFECDVVIRDGRDVLGLKSQNPFGTSPASADVTRFVSILSETNRGPEGVPIALPTDGEWLVRVLSSRDGFIFGEYRRHMKTIGYLGQLDRLFGGRATTRNWNTIAAIVRILEGSGTEKTSKRRSVRRPR